MDKTVELKLSGLRCASCVNKVQNALKAMPGVSKAVVNFADRSAAVSGDNQLTEVDLIKKIEALGYHAEVQPFLHRQHEDLEAKHAKRLMNRGIISLLLGLILMAVSFMKMPALSSLHGQWMGWGFGLLSAGIIFYAGKHFFVNGWHAFKQHVATMDTLVALGISTALIYSFVAVAFTSSLPNMMQHLYFEAALIIVGLINIGNSLEAKARSHTSVAVEKLIGLQPKTAQIIRNLEEITIAIETIIVGDFIRVRPGEKVPVDGVLTEGHSTIDESMFTGESVPSTKKVGDKVTGGTLNKAGSFIFQATKVGKDTALAQIVAMIRQAQATKPALARLADKVSGIFVPVVVVIAVLTALIWYNIGPEPQLAYMFATSMTVLIIACPCAVGLAVPISVIVGVGKAAEQGILFRQGEALETATHLTTIVFDKTGTLTLGRPTVTAVQVFQSENSNKITALAASIELHSEHPLALAVVEYAKKLNLELPKAEGFHAITGQGVSAMIEGKLVYLGNLKFLGSQGVNTAIANNAIQNNVQQGQTVIYMAVDNKVLGAIAIEDPIKTEAKETIRKLHALGLKTVMLTGDQKGTAQAVAAKLGITEVIAEVLPEDKSNVIAELQGRGEKVGMVGDGINDAPALAKANVGFAIGTGTDVAIESAAITLMHGSLYGISDAIAISKATRRNMKQNLFGAFIYNVLGIPIAAGILYPFFGLLLNPMLAGLFMALSSVTVVMNANRLRWFELGD